MKRISLKSLERKINKIMNNKVVKCKEYELKDIKDEVYCLFGEEISCEVIDEYNGDYEVYLKK